MIKWLEIFKIHLVWHQIDTSMRSRPSVSVSSRWLWKPEITWHPRSNPTGLKNNINSARSVERNNHYYCEYYWKLKQRNISPFLFLALTRGDPQLLEEYNECVKKLKDFRSSHLQIVARLALLVNWQCSSLNISKTAGVKLLLFGSIYNYWLIAENRWPKLDIMLCYVGTLWFQEIEENQITSWEWLWEDRKSVV